MSSSKPATPWLREVQDKFVSAIGGKSCLCGEASRPARQSKKVGKATVSINVCQRCKGVVR